MENKNKYYDIAERIYDLDGEVYECVGSSRSEERRVGKEWRFSWAAYE